MSCHYLIEQGEALQLRVTAKNCFPIKKATFYKLGISHSLRTHLGLVLPDKHSQDILSFEKLLKNVHCNPLHSWKTRWHFAAWHRASFKYSLALPTLALPTTPPQCWAVHLSFPHLGNFKSFCENSLCWYNFILFRTPKVKWLPLPFCNIHFYSSLSQVILPFTWISWHKI